MKAVQVCELSFEELKKYQGAIADELQRRVQLEDEKYKQQTEKEHAEIVQAKAYKDLCKKRDKLIEEIQKHCGKKVVDLPIKVEINVEAKSLNQINGYNGVFRVNCEDNAKKVPVAIREDVENYVDRFMGNLCDDGLLRLAGLEQANTKLADKAVDLKNEVSNFDDTLEYCDSQILD